MSSTKKYTTVYICSSCGEQHSDEDDANECCEAEVEGLYECTGCAELYDSLSAAVRCCVSGELIRCGNCARDYKSDDINAYVLAVVGKCTRCTPLISVEDRCEIDSRVRGDIIKGTQSAALEKEIHKL